MARVLVVEDDPAILEAVASALARDGHEILTASDGVTGLGLARRERLELIVLDLMLPGMSGLDACRLIRAEQPTPIIILTARADEQDRVGGLETGADDYLTKPFSMLELRARVSALLRRDQLSKQAGRPAREAEVICCGELVLDLGRHELSRGGQAVPLRPREFLLLEYLMRNQRRARSREDILQAVWGYSYSGETRTVDVHVRWLREKIENDASRPHHLVTLRGFGYRFDP